MKVLIVNAFACRKAFKTFDGLVRAGFETVLEHEQGQTEFIVRDFNKLEVRSVCVVAQRASPCSSHRCRRTPYSGL